jgi:hypothetical protein
MEKKITKSKNSLTKGEEPEALSKFAQVARNNEGQPVRDGVLAKPDTSPIATDPKLKQDAATKVFREGVFHKDQGAKEAIDRLPDRTAKGTSRPIVK